MIASPTPATSGNKTVILGAGPSGLGVGLGLVLNGHQGDKVLIEKKPTPGGLAGSFSWKEHTIDFGPHRLATALAEINILAEQLLGPDLLVRKGLHGVQFGGSLYQFPPMIFNWLRPYSFYQAVLFALSFVAGKFAWVTRRFDADSFRTNIARQFGMRFYDAVVEPMATKVWGDPESIDPLFVAQRFVILNPLTVLSKFIVPSQRTNPSTFFYPRLGYQQLWDQAIEYYISLGGLARFESVPTRIDVDGQRITGVTVQAADGATTRFEGQGLEVVSTIPIQSLLSVIHGLEGVEEMRARAKSVKVRSMLLVAMEFEQPKTLPYRTLIFPESRYCFNRLFEQNQYSESTVAAGKSVVIADITLPLGSDEYSKKDEEIIARVTDDMRTLAYVDLARMTDVCLQRVEYAYVVPELTTRQAMYEVTHALGKIANLRLLGRFSVGEYDNSDYAIDNGLLLGALLSGRITELEYMSASHGKRGRHILE